MAEKQGKTCVVYLRTSTSAQKDAQTIGAQRGICEQIVKHGLPEFGVPGPLTVLPFRPSPADPKEAPGWIVDDGISGRLLEGRRFLSFVEAVRKRKVHPDYLVVFDASRLSRPDTFSGAEMQIQSAQDDALISSVLRGHGVRVLDPDGVYSDVSEKSSERARELARIRKRMMTGKHRWLAEGKHCSGRVPYGYDVDDDGKAIVHPEQAKHLLRIYDWYLYSDEREQGGYAYAAREANKAKIPAPALKYGGKEAAKAKKRTEPWSQKTVEHLVRLASVYATGEQTRMLASAFARGEATPYKVAFPKLIDPKLYALIERRRNERTLKAKATFLPSGLCVCGGCGANVIVKNGTDRVGVTRHYARCPGKCGSMSEGTFAGVLWVTAVCRCIEIQASEKANGNGSTHSHERELRTAKAAVADVQDEIAKLLDLYLSGLDKALWRERNDALNDRKASAQAEVERIERERDTHATRKANERGVEARIAAVLGEVARGPTLDRKREILRGLLNGERVVVKWRAGAATVTLPAFGSLPAVSTDSDELLTDLAEVREAASMRDGYDRLVTRLGKSMTDEVREHWIRIALHGANLLGDPEALHTLDAVRRRRRKRWTDAQVRSLLDIVDDMMPSRDIMIAQLRAVIPHAEASLAARCGGFLAHLEGTGPKPAPFTAEESAKLRDAIRELGIPKVEAKGKGGKHSRG